MQLQKDFGHIFLVYSRLSNKRAEWNKRAGWAEFWHLSYQKLQILKKSIS